MNNKSGTVYKDAYIQYLTTLHIAMGWDLMYLPEVAIKASFIDLWKSGKHIINANNGKIIGELTPYPPIRVINR